MNKKYSTSDFICFISILCIICAVLSGISHAETKAEKQKKAGTKEIIKIDDESGAGEESKQEEDTNKKGAPEGEQKAGEESEEKEEAEDVLEVKKGPQFKFKGLAKNLFTFHQTNNYVDRNPLVTTDKDLAADLTRLRLSPELLYRDILDVKIDYDNELIASNYGDTIYFKSFWRPVQYNDFLRITWEPYNGKNAYYRTKIHRAYVKVSVDHFTGTVGRQQIRFGSGKLWNPLDILNPISPTYLEGIDEQKGTDAVKLDFFPDEKSEITVVYDLKKSNNEIEHFNMKDCNYIVRAKTSIDSTDIAVLGGYVTRRGLAGFDFAAILFDGMFRGSLMVSQAGEPYLGQSDPWYPIKYLLPGKDESLGVYFQANTGYEYTFKEGVYFLLEYFYNQKAINYNKDQKAAFYLSQFNFMDQKTYLQLANQFLTINQHYIGLALGYDFHPLVRGDFFTIADIQGRGIFWSPSVKISAYENLDFSVGVMGAFTFNNRMSDFSEFRKNYLFYATGSYVF
jgi:hypothetical protein